MYESGSNPGPAAWLLVGATAVGKTAVAHYLAERLGSSILSTDAMLVYRGMDLGTAKPSRAERAAVRYLGIDLTEPDQPFSTGAWLQAVRAEVAAAPELRFAGTEGVPTGGGLLAVGGTGLYVRALTQGLELPAADPVRRRYWQERLAREGLAALQHELAARLPGDRAGDVDAANPRRVIRALEQLEQHGTLPAGWRAGAPPRVVGLRMPRALLHRRIEARVQQMFADGLLAEVDALRRRYPAWRAAPDGAPDADDGGGPDAARTATARQAIGYAEACDLLDKRLTRAQAIERIAARTRQLAKRQETWFRHQAEVHWIDLAPDEPVPVVAERVVAAWSAYGPTPIRLS